VSHVEGNTSSRTKPAKDWLLHTVVHQLRSLQQSPFSSTLRKSKHCASSRSIRETRDRLHRSFALKPAWQMMMRYNSGGSRAPTMCSLVCLERAFLQRWTLWY
jgi:hypothetical protein